MWKFWKKDTWTPMKEKIKRIKSQIDDHLDKLAEKKPGSEIKYRSRLDRADREKMDFMKHKELDKILGSVKRELGHEAEDERLKRKTPPSYKPPLKH